MPSAVSGGSVVCQLLGCVCASVKSSMSRISSGPSTVLMFHVNATRSRQNDSSSNSAAAASLSPAVSAWSNSDSHWSTSDTDLLLPWKYAPEHDARRGGCRWCARRVDRGGSVRGRPDRAAVLPERSSGSPSGAERRRADGGRRADRADAARRLAPVRLRVPQAAPGQGLVACSRRPRASWSITSRPRHVTREAVARRDLRARDGRGARRGARPQRPELRDLRQGVGGRSLRRAAPRVSCSRCIRSCASSGCRAPTLASKKTARGALQRLALVRAQFPDAEDRMREVRPRRDRRPARRVRRAVDSAAYRGARD